MTPTPGMGKYSLLLKGGAGSTHPTFSVRFRVSYFQFDAAQAGLVMAGD